MVKDVMVSVILNTLEAMSADASDKGKNDFGLRLTCEDVRILTSYVHALEREVSKHDS